MFTLVFILIGAADGGLYESVELLIDAGADVNATDRYKRTALMLSTLSWSVNTVKMLLKKGAHINKVNDDNQNALLYFGECRNLYCDRNQDITMVLYAAGEARLEEILEDNHPLPYLAEMEDRTNLKHMCRKVIRNRLVETDATFTPLR